MLPFHKTKIVCTLGPSSISPETIRDMLAAGMNVARLNFSHGDFDWHRNAIQTVRKVSREVGKETAIMADLPGPKIRIGALEKEPVLLSAGDKITLTSEEIIGNQQRVFASIPNLPKVIKPGDIIFLNDGIIQLRVLDVIDEDARCVVVSGGELRSRKGLNLPGVDLDTSAFTEFDHQCLRFALEQGVDAVSQSFVTSAQDIRDVRKAAEEMGQNPMIIAKIERAGVLKHIDEIMDSSDGIMIARGDLGVELPISEIAVVQKQLIAKANQLGKPVITATQMLESMVRRPRPTRAEATDVANAILDGTDAVMLSEESAMGQYPVAAVAMLAQIAKATEPHRPAVQLSQKVRDFVDQEGEFRLVDLIARMIDQSVTNLTPSIVIVPTVTGYTARMAARFKLPVWVLAVSRQLPACKKLVFSYGIYPIHIEHRPEDWAIFARDYLSTMDVPPGQVVLTSGPSHDHPDANHRLEILNM
jgi:pyruvate kinase